MKIILRDHDPDWKKQFHQESDRLEELFYPHTYSIEHIGSTSIPGLCAKPIIDIMVGVPALEELDLAVKLLLKPGYTYVKKYEDVMPWRRFFIKCSGDHSSVVNADDEVPALVSESRTHHIHIVRHGKRFWNEHLLFRDYMRTHEEARLAYSILKQKLAEREWKDGNEYAAAKANFIRSVLEKARYEG